MLRCLRPLTLPPETTVQRTNQASNCMYFVSRGLLFVMDGERVMGTMADHDYFGEKARRRRK